MNQEQPPTMRHPSQDRQADLLPVMIAPIVELAINHVLRFAPATRHELSALAGNNIRLAITAPRLELTLCLAGDHCQVKSYCEEPVQATIRGPLFSLLRQLGFNNSAGQLMASTVNIAGDTQLVQRLAQVIKDQDYDIEEPLSHVLGDVAARTLGQGLKAVSHWLGGATQQFAHAGSRILADEGRLSVTRRDWHHFSDAVDTLRDDIDRLDARINRLTALAQRNPSF